MTENDDPAEAMLRLEMALERIALVARPAERVASEELASRVDALIVRLKTAIGVQDE